MGSVSSRASTAFCWLPPERLENAAPGPGGADVEPLHQRRAASRPALLRSSRPKRVKLVEPVEDRVLGEAHAGHAADGVAVFRDDADARRGDFLRAIRAVRSVLPRYSCRPLAAVMPASTAPSSLWPLPSTPATPTISPRSTVSVKLSSRVTP